VAVLTILDIASEHTLHIRIMSPAIVSDFVCFNDDGLELVVNTSTGLAYASARATARMLETSDTNIHNELKNPANNFIVSKAEIPTSQGVRTANLLPAGVVFKLAFKYHPVLAQKMGEAGANLYMLKLAGYEPKIVETPQIPTDYASALRLAADEHEARLIAESQLAIASAQLESNAPLVEYATAVQASDTAIDLGDYAKMIGTGRTRLFRAMREAGVVMKKSTMVYQHWIDAGYFDVSQELADNGKLIPFALITGKGQLWLKQRLVEKKRFEQQMIAAIAGGVTQMSMF
jgi:phage antirepressor YoqD-like protein